ncbi:hypothetical protein ACIA74_44085 [Streptomyces sp. NPDC051658]|uniref:hypothetical protein n=1 Tax=Streptomyces sp. NPDC051658 TaxID=3365667 RepID=UPI0037A3B36D
MGDRRLWQVHVALQRARDGEPDAAGLGEPVREAGDDCHLPRTADDFVDRLNRALTVLLLDIPAVRTLATTLALQTPQDTHVQAAYEQIRAACTTAGIS